MHRLRQLFRCRSSASTSSPSTSSPSTSSPSRVRPLPDDDDDDDEDDYYTPRDGTERHLFRLGTQKMKERDSVAVLSYNILADCMSWERRCWLLLKEIVRYDADVICLQESQSDHMHRFWVPELGKHGYQQFHAVKKHIRIRDFDASYYSEGCAVFYRPHKMNLVHSYKIYFEKTGKSLSKKLVAASKNDKIRLAQDNLAIAAVFELEGSGIRFCVSTCHINAGHDNSDVKLMQVTEMIRGLKKLHRLKLPIIVCGDFNTSPNEPPYRFLVDGCLGFFDGLKDESKVYLHLDLEHDLELCTKAYYKLMNIAHDFEKFGYLKPHSSLDLN